MQVVKTRPEYLRQEVKFFYSIAAGARDHGNRINRRLPDGTLDLVLTLEGSARLSSDRLHFKTRPPIALTGLHTASTLLSSQGALHEVGAVLQPGFATRFFPDIEEENSTGTIDARLVFGQEAELLRDALASASTEQQRHRLLEYFLVQRLQPDREIHVRDRIADALQQIHSQRGCIALPTLYRSHCMSERTFRRQFVAQVGISPKRYSTIVRIKSFCQQYQHAPVNFVHILRDLDYADPAHFHKDFQKIAGISPGSYFRDMNAFGSCFISLM